MDRTQACGARNAGPIPAEGTLQRLKLNTNKLNTKKTDYQ